MRIVVSIIVSVLILGIGIGSLVKFGKKPDIPQKEAANSDTAVPVETAAVVNWNQPLLIDIDGEASTWRVITVGAQVAGQIVWKSDVARNGTLVKAGTELFRIDDVNLTLEVDRLLAEQRKAQAELNAIDIDLKNIADLIALAKEDWQLQKKHLTRIQTAFQRNATTETEVDTTLRQELAARNTLQGLTNQQRTQTQEKVTRQAALDLITAQLKQAQTDLKRCTVVCPIDGTIVDDIVEQGDYIMVGDPLVHISDSSRMEIKCSLHADELKWIWQQKNQSDNADSGLSDLQIPQVPCEVLFEFEGHQYIWDGMLSRYEGTGMDRETRTMPCRVLVANPRHSRVADSAGGTPTVRPPVLLSGMYVDVRIPVQSPAQLLRLPSEAVRPGGQVWTVRDGKLQIMTADVARTEDRYALIRQDTTGLTVGDRVIVSPLASVSKGMDVNDLSDVDDSADVPPMAEQEVLP